MNIRVHPEEARQMPGFSSIELNDGTGDMAAVPTVFHNIHCLVRLLQDFFMRKLFTHICLTESYSKQYARCSSLNTTSIPGRSSNLYIRAVSTHIWITASRSTYHLWSANFKTFLTDATTVVSVNLSCVTPTCLCTPTGGSLNRRNPRS